MFKIAPPLKDFPEDSEDSANSFDSLDSDVVREKNNLADQIKKYKYDNASLKE